MERAYLGGKQILKTGVFWQSLLAFVYASIFTVGVPLDLRERKPELFLRLWPLYAILAFLVLALTLVYLRRASRIKTLLRQSQGQPEYHGHLLSAKALTQRYFRTMMGLGVAMNIFFAIAGRI